jgi:hypothetical protein
MGSSDYLSVYYSAGKVYFLTLRYVIHFLYTYFIIISQNSAKLYKNLIKYHGMSKNDFSLTWKADQVVKVVHMASAMHDK